MASLHEMFAGPAFDPRLRWHHPPPSLRTGAAGLVIETAAGTDFWQGTHYGFRIDNGHFLGVAVAGDFVIETRVRTEPVHQYDQAGLMIRLSPECWLKTSVEFEPGHPSRLGAVVTNGGWSDWSTQDIGPEQGRDVAFRIGRTAADYLVEAALQPGGRWTQIRLARLHADAGGEVEAGLYCCSPKAAGFRAGFAMLRIGPPAPA